MYVLEPLSDIDCGISCNNIDRENKLNCSCICSIQIITHCVFCFQEQIALLLGGTDKVDAHHVSSCVSYCKEKYTLWRADIRKKVDPYCF